MDRRQFIRTLGFITGGLAFGGVKAVKGVAKAVIAEKPAMPEFPHVKPFLNPMPAYDTVPVMPMAEPTGQLFYMKPIEAWEEMTKILSDNIASDINDNLIKLINDKQYEYD